MERKEIIREAVKFICGELKIKQTFSIKLSKNRKGGFVTYAFYNSEDKSIHVYVKNRGLADIIRSVFHEIVHRKQDEENKIDINKPPQDVGGDIENQANSKAGELIKKFGYLMRDKNINIYDL